jgi:catechol 2,3-dioxygenase-like lactoylglutathione lyase family enzyme
MPDTPLRLHHLAIPVYDAARTLRFYTEVLQLQRVRRWIAAHEPP